MFVSLYSCQAGHWPVDEVGPIFVIGIHDVLEVELSSKSSHKSNIL
jgi:hypothetical protein